MLPSPLLDLVSLRLSTRINPVFSNVQVRGHIRHVQQLAAQRIVRPPDELPLKTRPSGISPNHRPLKVQQTQDRDHVLSELEARVAALKEVTDTSIQAAEAQQDGPHLPELALQNIYKDLLAYPEPSPLQEQSPATVEVVSAADIVHILQERLPELEAAAQREANNQEGLASRLQARLLPASSHPVLEDSLINRNAEANEDLSTSTAAWPLRELLGRLRVVLDTHRISWLLVEQENTSPEVKPALFRLLTNAEWHALTEACLLANDASAAVAVLDLMKNVGLVPSDEQNDMILGWYANKGLVESADAYVAGLALDIPSERHRDLLIKARVKAMQVDEACALLHRYETSTHPAPITSYTRVIHMLLYARGPGSAQRIAQAWDLFAHMRYVAHPVPDIFLYSVMIRAASEPERALDLFTEMTVEQRIVPDAIAYNSVIRACARSKTFALHAFRIAREMLNTNRDAYGEVPVHLRPDIHTFLALLEAAKRIGDLARARWIFVEVARGARGMGTDGDKLVYVDERVLVHLFHAYTAYRPPFHRATVSVVRDEAPSNVHPGPAEDAASQAQDVEPAGNLGSRGIPQSRGDVIREVTMLWERVLHDCQQPLYDSSAPPSVFGRVQLNTTLLNAYVAVYYAHSLPSEAYKLYHTLFESLGVKRDDYSYVLALEAYAGAKNRLPPRELDVALSAARSAWEGWLRLEQDASGLGAGVQPRLVVRAWSAMIRLLSLAGNIREAEDLLRRFVRRYPPELVKQPAPVDPQRSNRIRLYAERPLVRLMEPSAVPEDRITPFLTFTDILPLYNRALVTGRVDIVHYIKWATSAYEGALRRRRAAQLRGRDDAAVQTKE